MPQISFDKLGNIDSKCPNCDYVLDTKPTKKKKCPNCGNYIFVRTRPLDRQKVLVTESQISKIEEQWTAYYEQIENEQLESDPEFMDTKKILAQKWGKEPSVNDVKWSLANKYLLQHSQVGNWGLYRNTRLEMAEILRKEKRLEESLRTYFDVCYLDINGPTNRGGLSDPGLLGQYPPFDPKRSFLAPGIIACINELGDEIGAKHEDLTIPSPITDL